VRLLCLFVSLAVLAGCRGSDATPTRGVTHPAADGSAPPAARAAAVDAVDAADGVAARGEPLAIEGRFAPPPGFARVAAAPGTFAAYLRAMRLLPEGALVVDYAGRPLYDQGRHARIAAVVDIDVGSRDLQQCADTIVRLHAEWRYAGGERNLSYRTATGTTLSYREWLAGGRAIATGAKLVVERKAAAKKDDRQAFRQWLDEVFAWANTASLERDGARVALKDVQGGDFFVASGRPFGHAVLVADVAKDERGRLALLLVQGFMPAQSVHVLRATDQTAWFVVEPDAAEVTTPFWAPFPASALRRLPGPSGALACLERHYGAASVASVPWDDGAPKTMAEKVERPDLEDMLSVPYAAGPIAPVTDTEMDPGRARVAALFRAAYGATSAKVSASLVPVRIRGRTVSFHERAAGPLRRVAERLERIDDPAVDRFFASMGGTFADRTIAGTERTSAHAWGIAIDLDPSLGDYWKNAGSTPRWKNRVPQAIVDAFEAEGFAWGGRWYHYDTMHFEYRPELLDPACAATAAGGK
jgi:hypothetical protein